MSLEDLKNRREALIKEFHIYNPELTLEDKKQDPNNFENPNSKTWQKSRPPPILSNANEELKIDPSTIFKKKISPLRGKSPSALRYSPLLSPASERIERKKTFDCFSNTDSPPCSTRSSTSSMDKLLGANNFTLDSYKTELLRKYQEQREIRNKAHEEMLLLKEKMLKKREKKLESMIKFIIKSDSKSKDLIDDRELSKILINSDDVQASINNKKYVKPPRSPRDRITSKIELKNVQSDKIVQII